MPDRLRVLIIAGSMLLLGLLAMVKFQTPLAWVLVPVIMSAAWMLGDPKRLLAGYWLYACFAEYAYRVTGLGVVRYGDEALLGLIVVALIFEHALRRRTYKDLRPIMLVFWALCVLLALSFLVNRGSHLKAGITAIQYYRPFVLGYLAYTSMRREDLPNACRFFLATLLLQLFLNVMWFFDINYPLPHPGIYGGVDFAVGTMGTSLQVAYTACLGIVLSVAIYLNTRRLAYLIVAGLLLVSFALTNTAHAYSFLAIMLVVLVVLPTKRTVAQMTGALGYAAGFLVLALALASLMPYSLTVEQYKRRAEDLLTGRKMAAYAMHFTELYHDVPVFLLGAGPGNLGTAMADDRSYLAAKYHGWSFQSADLIERSEGSIVSHTRTGLLAIWGDMGPLAFLLYWGAHLFAMFRVTRAYRLRAYTDPWQRALGAAFVPAMLLYFFAAFMTDLVHMALWGFYPWVWAGLVWTPYRTDENAEADPEVEVNVAALEEAPPARLTADVT